MSLLTDKKLILASASPRREQLLTAAGAPPQILRVDAAEEDDCSALGGPAQLVMANARHKLDAAFSALGETDALIITADTVVWQDGRLFGKPKDREDAAAMLRSLAGKSHSVFTGQCLADGKTRRVVCRAAETRVHFAPMSEDEISRYLDENDAWDKAGAYGMQSVAGWFVTGIEGDYSTVVGLSLPLLYRMAGELSQD